MTAPRSRAQSGSVLAAMLAPVVTIAAIAGCGRGPVPLAPVPSVPAMVTSEPVPSLAATTGAQAPAKVDSASKEKLVTLTGTWDVRLALEEIAKAGGFSLMISPEIPPVKLHLSLVNVPASDALMAVIGDAGLTLDGDNAMRVPWNPSVVFYQLPVNIDSLSVEAIMKRFSVNRDLAELIVKSRKP